MTRQYGPLRAPVQYRHVTKIIARRLHVPVIACALLSPFALAAGAVAAEPVEIVVLGDSLAAGFGLPEQRAFPIRLQAALKDRGLAASVINAGVSGDTSSGGRDRLDWSIPQSVDAVIVELGANDALRGIDPALTRAALDDILTRLRQRHIAVLLCGMKAPPNMGADYVARFDAIFPDLARKHDVLLYPFFLDGVAAEASLNQRDGIHPNAEGVDVIVERVMPSVMALIEKARAAKP